MINNTQKIKEEIIKEFEEKIGTKGSLGVYYGSDTFNPDKVKSFLVDYVVDYIRQTTIEECIEAMPKEKQEKHLPDCHEYEIDRKLYECSCGNDVYVKSWNNYRTQALTKLKALKKDDKLCFGCQTLPKNNPFHTCKRSAN